MATLGFDRAFIKQPSEKKTVRLEYQDVADNMGVGGFSLSTASVKIYDKETGQECTSAMAEGVVTVDSTNNYVYVTIKAGESGKRYVAKIVTTWVKVGQPDQIDEKDLLIRVEEKGL